MENCSGIPGVVYNFNTQNFISYPDNFHAIGDIPFVIYFDFETTAPTDTCFDPEQKKMSHVVIVAFHPELKLNHIIKQRSYAHSTEQLTSLNYFTQEQIKFLDNDLIKMLKEMVFDVSKRKCKNTMGQMFCIESALVKKTLLRWFNTKYKQQFVKMNPLTKIHLKTQKCVICRLPLKVEPTNFKTPDDEMSHGDFVIRYGHKFLRNIYTYVQIKDSYHIKDLESYYKISEEYIAICVELLAIL